ncbi:repressor CpxP [Atlantibacter hermannii]|nr:repressor CpxP [Atlantibacter hermannii]
MNSRLLMLAKWRPCIAWSPQKILMKTLCELRPKRWPQEQVARQVEMAKVRNQMYRLLTPEQQAVLNEKHQYRMTQLREVSQMQRSSSANVFSSTTRSSNQ